jgi:hypothetical protein
MESIKYIIDSKGRHSGLILDLSIIRKTLRKKKDLVELIENIEDIVAVALRRNEKSVSFEKVQKQIHGKKKLK